MYVLLAVKGLSPPRRAGGIITLSVPSLCVHGHVSGTCVSHILVCWLPSN